MECQLYKPILKAGPLWRQRTDMLSRMRAPKVPQQTGGDGGGRVHRSQIIKPTFREGDSHSSRLTENEMTAVNLNE